MSLLDVDLNDLRITGRGDVLHKPGAVRLDAYPLLVYAPDRGPGVRTEDKGLHVASVCNAVAQLRDYEAVATSLGTTPEHVRQSVAYALAAGYLASGE